LDRKVTAILARPLKAAASTQQKRQLAAIILNPAVGGLR